MVGDATGVFSYAQIVLWALAVVALGLVLAYATQRAGRLRRPEREQFDRATVSVYAREEQSEAIRLVTTGKDPSGDSERGSQPPLTTNR